MRSMLARVGLVNRTLDRLVAAVTLDAALCSCSEDAGLDARLGAVSFKLRWSGVGGARIADRGLRAAAPLAALEYAVGELAARNLVLVGYERSQRPGAEDLEGARERVLADGRALLEQAPFDRGLHRGALRLHLLVHRAEGLELYDTVTRRFVLLDEPALRGVLLALA